MLGCGLSFLERLDRHVPLAQVRVACTECSPMREPYPGVPIHAATERTGYGNGVVEAELSLCVAAGQALLTLDGGKPCSCGLRKSPSPRRLCKARLSYRLTYSTGSLTHRDRLYRGFNLINGREEARFGPLQLEGCNPIGRPRPTGV